MSSTQIYNQLPFLYKLPLPNSQQKIFEAGFEDKLPSLTSTLLKGSKVSNLSDILLPQQPQSANPSPSSSPASTSAISASASNSFSSTFGGSISSPIIEVKPRQHSSPSKNGASSSTTIPAQQLLMLVESFGQQSERQKSKDKYNPVVRSYHPYPSTERPISYHYQTSATSFGINKAHNEVILRTSGGSKAGGSSSSDQQTTELLSHRQFRTLLDTVSFEEGNLELSSDDSSVINSPSMSTNVPTPPSSPMVSPRTDSQSQLPNSAASSPVNSPLMSPVLSNSAPSTNANCLTKQQIHPSVLLNHLLSQGDYQVLHAKLQQQLQQHLKLQQQQLQQQQQQLQQQQQQLQQQSQSQQVQQTQHHQQQIPLQANNLSQGHLTPLDCFRTIFQNVIGQLADIISKVRNNESSSIAASTHYLGSRFPITNTIIESFIVVSLFINSHSLDRISDYWSTEQAKVFPDVGQIPRILSRNKYFEIKSSLSSILTGDLLEQLQSQLQQDISRNSRSPNPEPLQASRFKTPVKHRNSTKELASFNLLLEYGLSHVCDLFNHQRSSSGGNTQQHFIPLVQVVEILTEQICPSNSDAHVVSGVSNFSNSNNSTNNSEDQQTPHSPSSTFTPHNHFTTTNIKSNSNTSCCHTLIAAPVSSQLDVSLAKHPILCQTDQF